MIRPSGIVYYDSVLSDARHRVYLPLEEVNVKVVIVDGEFVPLRSMSAQSTDMTHVVSARVTLSQSYSNPSESSTGRCKYCFPVPASAAVCAFGMTMDDGRTIKGIAKDKDQARQGYKQALDAGRSANVLEYVTDDSQYRSLSIVCC